jgi:hypothetical protein
VPQARPPGQPDGHPQIVESVRLKVQIGGSPDPEKGMVAQGLASEEQLPHGTFKKGDEIRISDHGFYSK